MTNDCLNSQIMIRFKLGIMKNKETLDKTRYDLEDLLDKMTTNELKLLIKDILSIKGIHKKPVELIIKNYQDSII